MAGTYVINELGTVFEVDSDHLHRLVNCRVATQADVNAFWEAAGLLEARPQISDPAPDPVPEPTPEPPGAASFVLADFVAPDPVPTPE